MDAAGSANVNVPAPVGAIEIVPPVVATVAANPAGALITMFTLGAELPESIVIAEAPVAVIDGLVAVATNVRFGVLICTGPPPFMVSAVLSATVSTLPAAVAKKDVVPVVWKDDVPAVGAPAIVTFPVL